MTEILMPALSDSMEEGTILSWLVADGATVAVGDELCEIETDKATMTYTAEHAGTVTILAQEGTALAVGEPMAQIGDTAVPPVSAPVRAEEAPTAAAANGNGAGAAPARVTPLARRAAEVHEVALESVSGSGPRGRITRADVFAVAGVEGEALLAPAAPAAARPAPDRRPIKAEGGHERQDLSRLQTAVARRMAEAKATVPHFQVETEALMDAAIALRAELKAVADGAAVPSLNDMVIKAAALALCDHPRANGSYVEGGFELHARVNVGMAVASEDALVVATIQDADAKGLGEIAGEARRLAERVRSGEITPPELSGATFTISNLGMLGMTAMTPIINPPQAAILGVGALRPTLARDEGGEIVDRTLMTLTLSCDHRILYGADAARFLARVRDLLEAPLRLLL